MFRLDALQQRWDVARLPFTLRVLLENALRTGSDADVEAVAGWVAKDEPSREIGFSPSRVLLQDFTGVPVVVDEPRRRVTMNQVKIERYTEYLNEPNQMHLAFQQVSSTIVSAQPSGWRAESSRSAERMGVAFSSGESAR